MFRDDSQPPAATPRTLPRADGHGRAKALPGVILGALLVLASIAPGTAQGDQDPFGDLADEFDDLVITIMPSVTVTLRHPPYLGITVDRVAFARPEGKCSDELVNALIEDFVANGADVAERQRIEALLEEIDFSASGIIDDDHVVSLGQMLGPRTVVVVETHRCAGDKSRRREIRERKTKSGEKVSYPVYFATTRVDLKGSIRVVDLATGRVFTAKTFDENGSRTVSSEKGYPAYPSEYGLRDEALAAAVCEIHRMFFPWTETRELRYFKGKKCHLDTAYQLLRIDDVEGAAEQSADNLDFCLSQQKINPKKIKPKIVARAYYNLGMSYFMLDDFDKALEQLQQAYRLKPGRRIRETILECKRAKELAEEMRRYEIRTAAQGGSH